MHWLRVSSSCPKGKSNSAVHLRRRIEEEGSWGDVIRRRRFGRDEHLTRIAPVADALGLTRIRLQLAIYFCLHGGSLPENTAGAQPRFRGKILPGKFRKKLHVI
jgi:hypothetical protein